METGLFGLDDDVTRWVPELGKLEILVGFDEGERALLRERKERITLRYGISALLRLDEDWGWGEREGGRNG